MDTVCRAFNHGNVIAYLFAMFTCSGGLAKTFMLSFSHKKKPGIIYFHRCIFIHNKCKHFFCDKNFKNLPWGHVSCRKCGQ